VNYLPLSIDVDVSMNKRSPAVKRVCTSRQLRKTVTGHPGAKKCCSSVTG